jgi:uncharacterized protein (TIRG00374 family)
MASTPPEISDSQPKTSKSSRWFLIIAIPLAGLLLYLSLKGLDWAEFGRVISAGQYGFLGVVALMGSVNYFIRSQRWRVLLQKEQAVGALTMFWATMIGYLGNAYLPARAGEVLRSVALGKRTGISAGYILATALVERIIDVAALILIGAICLGVVQALPPIFQTGMILLAALAVGGLIFLFLLPSLEPFLQSVIRRFIKNEIWKAKILELLERFIQGFSVLRDLRRIALFLVFTAGIWMLDGLITMIAAQIIQQTLSLPQALLLLVGFGLSSAIPSTPGYIGVYQFVAVTILVPFGFTQSQAIAYALIAQISNYVVVSFWGLIALWRIKWKKADSRSSIN